MPGPRLPVRAVAVVVPARDEAPRIGCCLASVSAAVRGLGVPTSVLVVADHCADATAAVAAQAGALVLVRSGDPSGGVGAARAAGCEGVLGRLAGLHPRDVWLASTDADSLVPPGWLSAQLALAAADHAAVAGTVTLAVDDSLADSARSRWQRAYRRRHGHVHGANLGVRADAYLAVGGFPRVPAHEDLGLVDRLVAAGHRVARPAGPPVTTSARLVGRAPVGVAADLRALA